MPRSSIVIPVRNDPVRLAKLLDSFSESDWQGHEVLVVDDGSTDETPRVAARYPLRVVSADGHRGPSEARNLGARQAAEPVLVFIDSDVVLGPDAISRLTGWLADPEIAGVSTIASDEPENPGFVPRYAAVTDRYVCERWDAESIAGRSRGAARTCRWLSTRLGAIRADVFREVGGFDVRFTRPCIEDAEFSMRLGRKHLLILDPDVAHTHHWPPTLRVLLRRVFVNARLLMAVMREQDDAAPGVVPLAERAGRILGGLAVVLLPAAPFSTTAAIACAGCFAASAWTQRDLFGAYYRAGGAALLLGSYVLHYLLTCAGLVGAASALVADPLRRKKTKQVRT